MTGGVGGIEEFDFGTVLAQGQVLRHEFTLTNPTNQPMRVLKATALTPCCSEVGPISSATIAPGGHREIPAVLRIRSDRTGQKRNALGS